MQKLLIKELEDHQVKKNEFPEGFSFSDTFAKSIVEEPGASFVKVEKIKEEMIESAELPILAVSNLIGTMPLKTMYEDEERRTSSQVQRN